MLWTAVLVGLLMLIGVALTIFRRRLLVRDVRSEAGEKLDQLERLRRQGLISEEEFRRGRRAVLGVTVDAGGDGPVRAADDGIDGASDDDGSQGQADEPAPDAGDGDRGAAPPEDAAQR